MINRYHIIIPHEVLAELQSIHAYISQDSPQNASLMIQRILDSLDSLRELPHRAKQHSQFTNEGKTVRVVSVPPYNIFVRVDDKNFAVRVLHVRHAARRPPKAL